jgi:nucleotide-binding universal stress UspA family protein
MPLSSISLAYSWVHELRKRKENAMLPVKTIVAPTDLSSESEAGLGAAAEIAKHFSATIHMVFVVTALPPIPGSTTAVGFHLPNVFEEMKEMVNPSMEDLVKKNFSPDLDVESKILIGDPAMEIVKLSDTVGADIIVMATHGQTGWRRFVSGSVTEKVIRHASIPVLAFKDREDSGKDRG